MRPLVLIGLCTALLAACTDNAGYNQNPNTYKGAGLGAALGAGAGALIGGSPHRGEGAAIGAVVGTLAGAGIGQYMDRQEAQMRQSLQGTGVEVQRHGDNILLNMPNSITFAFDSSRIRSEFHPTLNNVASVLNQYPQTNVEVIGHTDSTGTTAYNQKLSQERAQSVTTYLKGQGVVPNRLYMIGKGETQPIASNDTEAGRAQNRRVEVRISPVTQ